MTDACSFAPTKVSVHKIFRNTNGKMGRQPISKQRSVGSNYGTIIKDNRVYKRNVTIVVAIIAILASMLLPALGKARDAARKVSCCNQEKQIGLALQMYRDDNDDYFVYSFRYVNNNWGATWMYAVGGYAGVDVSSYVSSKMPKPESDSGLRWHFLKGWELLYCPNFAAAGGLPPDIKNYSLTTYSLNRQVCPNIPETGNYQLYRTIRKNSSCVLMTELDFRMYTDYPLVTNGAFYHYVDWYAHGVNAVINVLFCDGSVRSLAKYNTQSATYLP